MAQSPNWQAGVPLLVEQATLQPPQLVTLVCRFTQAPLQAVRPAPQTRVQAPLVQVSPLAHALPQAPQLLGSVASFTHVLLHNTCPAGQAPAVQTPPVQLPLWHCPADTQAEPFGKRDPQTPAVH